MQTQVGPTMDLTNPARRAILTCATLASANGRRTMPLRRALLAVSVAIGSAARAQGAIDNADIARDGTTAPGAMRATAPAAVPAFRDSIFRDPARLLAQQESQATPAGEAAALSPMQDWNGMQKSYVIPALEIIGFDMLLNLYDRAHYGCCDFHSNLPSIRRNLRSSWVVDADTFTVNQIGHPYQGSMYHGFARASGLGYWPALGYTFAGSAFWEIAGETTPPSKNDQISTGIGGSFLGEALFRMANLWLEQEHGSPFWREAGAAVISPPVGFNRLAFGNRFDAIFASHQPDYYSRLQAGVSSATQNRARHVDGG